MAAIISKLKDRLMEIGLGGGAGGLALALNDALYENIPFVHKYLGELRHAKDIVVPIAVGIAGLALDIEGVDSAITVGVAEGIRGAFDTFVFKRPFAFAKDASTIKVFNLDPNEAVEVWVDGGKVTFTTPQTTDSAGNATITLPTALAAGKHEVIVKTSKKAFYGYVAV